MRIHHTLLISAFILIISAISCTSDTKVPVVTEETNIPEQTKEIIAKAVTPPAEPTLSAAEIAAAKAAKVAEEEAAEAAIKAEKKEEKRKAASKERRRKRREKRKRKAAEKAAAEKAARKAAASTVVQNEPTTTVPTEYAAPPKEDLTNVDPELLAIVQPKSNGGTPAIRFDADSYDFGRIIQGKEIDHQFEFTNTGSAPLVINNVEVTCGCTTPFYPFVPIEPGERGKISVHFSSKGRLGNQSPTITVFTNTDAGTYELNLQGIIDTEREGQ